MNNSYQTNQEKFWAGTFGNEYINRNIGKEIVASNIALFSEVLKNSSSISSVLELGANIGLNLVALNSLLPQTQLSAIEINQTAVEELKKVKEIQNIYHESILTFKPQTTYDLVLSKTVLIHINPSFLNTVYNLLYQASKKYICIVEYYNQTPVEIVYRNHTDKLFKRDFAGEMLEKYPDLKLVNYGFCYSKDKQFPLDDLTWFLLEKM